MGEGKGWISIYRKIQDSWLWQEKPFDRAHAWIDLLLSANHQGKRIVLGNEILQVERGSFVTFELKLMEKWGWSKSKVRSFLKLLEDEQMLVKKSDKKKNTITIVNYDSYQDLKTTEEPQKDHARTTEEPPKNTNNNDNNINKDNNKELNPIEVYQNNIFAMPGQIEVQGLIQWSNKLGDELVIYAIGIAVKSNARNWRYIEKILMDWDRNGIKDLNQAKAHSESRKKKGGQKQNDGSRENNPKDKGEYNFNRPYDGPSYGGDIEY